MTYVALSRLTTLDECVIDDHKFERLKKCRLKKMMQLIQEEQRLNRMHDITVKEHFTDQMDVVNDDVILNILEKDVVMDTVYEQKQENDLMLNDHRELMLQDESEDDFLYEISRNETPEVMDVD